VFLARHAIRSREDSPSKATISVLIWLNVGILCQALDQVSRHGARQFPCPHQQVYPVSSLRQEHSPPPRRVSSPDLHYLLTFIPLRFDARRTIVNSVPSNLVRFSKLGRLYCAPVAIMMFLVARSPPVSSTTCRPSNDRHSGRVLQQFLNIAERERMSNIPADRTQNERRLRLPPLEDRWSRSHFTILSGCQLEANGTFNTTLVSDSTPLVAR
jgi:hypothetical protein